MVHAVRLPELPANLAVDMVDDNTSATPPHGTKVSRDSSRITTFLTAA